MQLRNSLYWGPLQYGTLSTHDPTALTAADYKMGRLRHWLIATNASNFDTLSLERDPSPDGSRDGQITWYDYDGKQAGHNYAGGWSLPSLAANGPGGTPVVTTCMYRCVDAHPTDEPGSTPPPKMVTTIVPIGMSCPSDPDAPVVAPHVPVLTPAPPNLVPFPRPTKPLVFF
jgi:hypothetical protein